MKKSFLLLFLLIMAVSVQAQPRGQRGIREANQKTIDAVQVPEAVKSAQESAYPGIVITRWELHNAKGAKKELSKYVAVFTIEGKRTRARYRPDGKSISATKYFAAATAPDVVKTAAGRYAGYNLMGGEEIITGKGTFYRIRLRQGAKKLTMLVDQNGAEVTKGKAPAEIEEDEGENEGNG